MRLILFFVFVVLLAAVETQAQWAYEYKGKNNFAEALTDVLNASMNQFARSRGGRQPQVSEPGLDAYKCRHRLPDVKEAYLFVPKDSGRKTFARYVLHKAGSRSDAEAAYLKDVQMLINTYKKKWMVYRDAVSDAGIVPGTKTLLCYQQPNGFVYGSARVVARQAADSSWAIHLEVDAGPSTFYYFTPRNAPVVSDLFVEGFRKNFAALNPYELQCTNNMPGFNCRVLRDSNGLQRLEYFKMFDSMFEVKHEFEVALTNVRAALGLHYLHRRQALPNGQWGAHFVHINDVARGQKSVADLLAKPMAEGFELVISLPQQNKP